MVEEREGGERRGGSARTRVYAHMHICSSIKMYSS
jgi:hypothetical protein